MKVHGGKFTEGVVKKLKPGKVQVDHFETLFKGRQLICTVNTSGLLAWSVGFYDQAKPAREKFAEYPNHLATGDFPTMKVQEAQTTGREYDVAAARARRRAKAQGVKTEGARAGSFRDIAERYFKLDVEAKGLRSKSEIRRMLEKYLYPVWADRPFVEIRRDAVNDLLDGIAAKGQADAVLGCFRQIANWYATRDENYSSPIVKGMKRHSTNGNGNGNGKRFLQDHEIKSLWSACDQLAPIYGTFAKLALLTGQRREKICTMLWTDIEDGVWHVRREDREKGTPEKIKLTKSALDALASLPRIAGTDWVFPALGGRTHLNCDYAKSRIDKVLPDLPHWSLHDLRRTCRKLLTRAGVSVDVGELALGHSLKGLQKIYDDIAEYQPHLDEAFTKVEAELLKILAS